jgi:hypothetical protein
VAIVEKHKAGFVEVLFQVLRAARGLRTRLNATASSLMAVPRGRTGIKNLVRRSAA